MARTADAMFKRATDIAIKDRYGKKPLEIGANLISRTTVAALVLLNDVAVALGSQIPLAWDPSDQGSLCAIEVYPAITRLARGAKDKGGTLLGLEDWIQFDRKIDTAALDPDAIDAAVCVLAAADFIEGRTVGPTDLELARAEGWIWAPQTTACLETRSA
jgi:hypothetical protein